MITAPPLRPLLAVPGRALRDDARTSSPAIAAGLRPGPSDALNPLGPGPRPPVRPTPALGLRTFLPGQGPRAAAQRANLYRRPIPPQPYTLRDARRVRVVRGAVVGRAAPLSYETTYTIPFDANAAARGS